MRKFLALTAAACCVAGVASAATFTNGGFETVDGRLGITDGDSDGDALNSLAGNTGSASWDVYTTLPGWTTIAGPGIEVQTNGTLSTIDAYDGEHYVELDSDGNTPGATNSGMSQTFDLGAGTYKFSFYYSPRTKDIGTNGISYLLFDGVTLADNVVGPSATNGSMVGSWVEITETFTLASDDVLTLQFNATGTANELGGFIDAISITAVPIPAAGFLLLGGLGGLAAMRRRKKS